MFRDPFDEQPDEIDEVIDETVDDKELTQLIDEWLNDARPERYSANDKEWMDPIIRKAMAELERRRSNEVVKDAARRRVYQRESTATRRTNRILRDVNDTGQMPFGWGEGDDWRLMLADILHLPLSISRERVRFGAATAEDLEQWASENKREQDKRNDAQDDARNGARMLATRLREQGVRTVENLRPDETD